MVRKVIGLTAILVLLIVSGATAQNYELDWSDVNTITRQSDAYTLEWGNTEDVVSLNLQTNEIEPAEEKLPPAFPAPVPTPEAPPSTLSTPPSHLQLSVPQFYDYGRYRVVDRVEVTIYRQGGGIHYQTFYNSGALRDYTVYLKGLNAGDRYKAFLVWGDGSNRTLEGSVQGSGWRTVYVDQPNPLAYKVWPSR
ncbi:MAG: hypothetical protein WC423_00450 [Vulcanimicrobiota bacterium]